MSTDKSLQDEALRLTELDRKVVRAVLESDTDELGRALGAYMELRKALKTRLLDESAIPVVDADAAAVLRKISTGDGMPSDKVIERLAAHTGEDIGIHEFDREEIEELGSDLFYSWFSHHEYIRGLAELRPLIIRAPVPESVSQLVGQVKGCYAFQQYDAAYALCRMVIEASVHDICTRCRLFPDLGENVILYAKYNWGDLRDKVSSGVLRDQLHNLYGRLCEVLHARRSVTAEEARAAFRETLEIIERMYEQHGL